MSGTHGDSSPARHHNRHMSHDSWRQQPGTTTDTYDSRAMTHPAGHVGARRTARWTGRSAP